MIKHRIHVPAVSIGIENIYELHACLALHFGLDETACCWGCCRATAAIGAHGEIGDESQTANEMLSCPLG